MNPEKGKDSAATTEHPCFVFGLELNGKGGGKPIDGQVTTTGPQWLHIDYSSPQAEDWLREQGLESAVIETLVRSESRPRTTPATGGLLVVLRAINMNPDADREDMVSIRMWLEPNRVITVRQRRLFAAEELRESIEAGRGPKIIPELVIELIERIADRITSFVDDLEERVIAYEEAVEAGNTGNLRRQVSELRRQTAVVRRFVAPLREALETLSRLSDDRLEGKWSFALRDQADQITRSVEDLDLVRERLHVVQEELLNRITQEQNNRMYLFSVVAAIFLPITFISGMFGMNTAGLPGLEHPLAFWMVVAGMVAITAGIIAYLRASKWF
jgi:zinc transporter